MTPRHFHLFIFIFGYLLSSVIVRAQIVPPEDSIGFPIGADYKLARWETILDYFHHLSENSDRVNLEIRGHTTEGLDFALVVISSRDNLTQLAKHKDYQYKLANPDWLDRSELESLARHGKTVVLINCNLHSTEVASSQMSLELAYELASENSSRIKEILENVIILLIPSTNPDGLNKVIDWYNEWVGTPYESSPMPWLYHKYTGHDNNRDWFMLTQVETRIVTELLYKDWYPQVVLDLHQMKNKGARFVIPPYFDPVNPNIPAILQRTLSLIGAQLAFDLTSEGFTGVLSNAVYDMWWHGGFRTVPYRHNMVGILTEAASANIASPVFQPRLRLKGHRRGLDNYAQQTNFPEPWPGGWWRLRDIVEYEKASVYSILEFASTNRDLLLSNFYKMGLEAVEMGNSEPPRAFLVPQKQRDPYAARRMLEILHDGGVRVHHATARFTADGVEYPSGTFVVPMAQPFRSHAKDLLEIQRYPRRRPSAHAPPERPYDIAGWTLPLQMGVNAIEVVSQFEVHTMLLDEIPKQRGILHSIPEPVAFLLKNQTNREAVAVNRLMNRSNRSGEHAGTETLFWCTREFTHRDKVFPRGSILIRTKRNPVHLSSELKEFAESLGMEIHALDEIPAEDDLIPLRVPRIGLYKPWVASIDEGWTRWVLEQHEFPYNTLRDSEIRAGGLAERYDVIILPDMSVAEIIHGHSPGSVPPEYAGGIGNSGAANLRSFAENGGTLICLNDACELAIEYFGLEVQNVLEQSNQANTHESPKGGFFCPGSLLRVFVETTHPIGYGSNRETAVFFKSGPAFEARGGRVIASYPNFNPLMSGWIEGEKRIRQKAAALDVIIGKGNVILFGFKPQHRAQSHGTFKLLFNAIYYSVIDRS
ncbi:MAG: M14 family metallopeptidase [Candidatus Poribacteria bacterium]|nr:M14 family metallopeptidase [Candidatus Poribacteria bacterium]